MKRIVMLAASLLVASAGFAQQVVVEKPDITQMDISLSDIKSVLGAMNVKMYSFDLSKLTETPHSLTIYVDSYSGKESAKQTFYMPVRSTIRYVNDFPEEMHADVREKFNLAPDEQVISRMDKLSVYMVPDNDSTMKLFIGLENYGQMNTNLKLTPIKTKTRDMYFYADRPFLINQIKEGEKIPLILYGSGWYEQESDLVRMCGESQIKPDLKSNEILENLPQYYVIGITAQKIGK